MRWLPTLLLTLAAALLAAAVWLLGTESGLRWVLSHAPAELAVEEPHGVLGGEITAKRIAWQGIEARGVALQVHLLALLGDTVSVGPVRVDALDIKLPPAKGGESKGGLPLQIKVSDARVRSVTYEGYEVNDLALDYSGSANGHQIDASFRAAGARATLKTSLNARAWPTALRAELEGVNLALIDPDYPQTALRVLVDGRGDEKSATGNVAVENPEAGPLDEERLPLARAQARFSTDYAAVWFGALTASLQGSGALDGSGKAGRGGAEFELRVRELDLRALRSSLARTRLAGTLALEAQPQAQRLRGTLAQDDLSLSADVERRGDDVEVRSLLARAAGGEASGRGRLKLGKMRASPIEFEADLRLAHFDPARFGDYPQGSLSGRVKGSGSLGGTRQGSFSWEIAGSTLLGQPLASSGRAKLIGQRVADADAWATLGANRATAKGAFGGARDTLAWTLELPQLAALNGNLGGQVSAQGSARGAWTRPEINLRASGKALRIPGLAFDTAALEASGTLDAHTGEVRARNADLDLKARLKGGWRAGRWTGELTAFQNAGTYSLALQKPAPLEIAAGRIALGLFEARSSDTRITLESLRWQEGRLDSAGSFAALRAQTLLDVMGEKRLAGDLRLDGEWSLVSSPKLNGRVSLRRSGGDLALAGPPEVALGISRAALDARLTDGRVDAVLDLATRLGDARVEGRAEGLTPDSAASYTAQIDLKELRLLTEPLWTQVRLAGRVGATLRGSGTLGRPKLTGSVRGDALAFEAPPYGISLGGGVLRAELDGDRLNITEASIAGGEGRFSVRGSLPLRLAEGGTALEWRAERFRVLNRPDMRVMVSGRGEAGFDGRKLALRGELLADSGHFEVRQRRLPTLDDDVVVVGRERPEAEKRAPLPLDLDLRVDLGEHLTVRGYGFDGGAAGQLHVVTSSAGELLAQGRVRAVRASFFAYGQNLDVDPGALVFDGPLTRPAFDITGWRRHQAVEAGVHLTGTVDQPSVELVSNPPVSDPEKLSWLVLGRAPSTASGADLAILQAASGALLASDKPPLQRRIASRFGLDEMTVRSSSELATRNSIDPTTNVFAVGKRLSSRLYLSFEQALGATAEYLVKADYSLTQRLSLRGQTGTTSGVGLFYRFAWD
jgi:translocation and assembly module TamB